MKLSILSVAVALFLAAGPVHAELTGCLTPGGTLIHVAVGESPLIPCTGQSVEVTFGAGLTAGDFYEVLTRAVSEVFAPQVPQTFIAECNPGDVVVGGGFAASPMLREIYVSANGPPSISDPAGSFFTNDGWGVVLVNPGVANPVGLTVGVDVTAICAPVAP